MAKPVAGQSIPRFVDYRRHGEVLRQLHLALITLVIVSVFCGCGSSDPWSKTEPHAEEVEVQVLETPSIDQQLSELAAGERMAIDLSTKLTSDQLTKAISAAGKIKSISSNTFEQSEPLLKPAAIESLLIRGKVNDAQFKLICAKKTLLRLNLPDADLTNAGLAEIKS